MRIKSALAKKEFPTRKKGGDIKSKTKHDEITRVTKRNLESHYINNPQIFNGINLQVNVLEQAGHRLIAKEDKVRNFYSDFFKRVGTRGGNRSWRYLLRRWYRDSFIFGWGIGEIIPDKKTGKIIDVDFISPIDFDYITPNDLNRVPNIEEKYPWLIEHKNRVGVGINSDKPLMDKNNNPVGYVQRFDNLGINRYIFFEPKRIMLIRLYDYGSGLYPVGLVEPISRTSTAKLNLQEAKVDSEWLNGDPLLYALVGNELNTPTSEMLSATTQQLAALKSDRVSSFKYYVEPKVLDMNKGGEIDKELDYFVTSEASGMGVPKSFVTESGDEGNKGTLGFLTRLLMDSLKSYQSNMKEALEFQLFKRITEKEDFTEIPSIEFGHVSIEDRNAQSKRLNESVKNGLITVSKGLQDYVLRSEGLELSKQAKDTLSEELPRLVLDSPYGSMAYNGETTIFIRKDNVNVNGRMFELIEDGKALGRIVITGVQEVIKKDFGALLMKHGISDYKKRGRLLEKGVVYAYHYRMDFKFPKPIPISEEYGEEGFYFPGGVSWQRLQ